MKLNQIQTFIAVVEANGFAAAARQLNVSTAAVSRMVSQLEASLNTQLLQRTTRSIALTDAGSIYYEQVKATLRELITAEQMITASQAEPTGILSVVSNRYFAIDRLLPNLSEFMALYPKLRVQLELAERFPDLVEEKIDLVFGVSVEGPENLVRRRVATTRYVLCAAPQYLEKYGTPKKPADLIQHRYITHFMRKPNNVVTFKDNKEVHIEPILALNDSKAMRECAVRGMGIVKLHDYVVSEALADGRLVELLSHYAEPEQAVYLYYQANRYLQPKIRQFIDFFLKCN